MEEQRLDVLIQEIESITNDIGKDNFSLEGLKEDIERMEKDQPFMHRHIALNSRKMNKLIDIVSVKMVTKQNLEAEFNALKLSVQQAEAKKKPVVAKKSTPKPKADPKVVEDKSI